MSTNIYARSDRLQFRCARTAGAICVRIVRNGPGIVFQGVGAGGRSVAIAATVRIAGYRPHGLSREAVGRIAISAWARTVRTVRTVAPPAFLARQKAGLSRC